MLECMVGCNEDNAKPSDGDTDEMDINDSILSVCLSNYYVNQYCKSS